MWDQTCVRGKGYSKETPGEKQRQELSASHTSQAANSLICSFGGQAAPGFAGIFPNSVNSVPGLDLILAIQLNHRPPKARSNAFSSPSIAVLSWDQETETIPASVTDYETIPPMGEREG